MTTQRRDPVLGQVSIWTGEANPVPVKSGPARRMCGPRRLRAEGAEGPADGDAAAQRGRGPGGSEITPTAWLRCVSLRN